MIISMWLLEHLKLYVALIIYLSVNIVLNIYIWIDNQTVNFFLKNLGTTTILPQIVI